MAAAAFAFTGLTLASVDTGSSDGQPGTPTGPGPGAVAHVSMANIAPATAASMVAATSHHAKV